MHLGNAWDGDCGRENLSLGDLWRRKRGHERVNLLKDLPPAC